MNIELESRKLEDIITKLENDNLEIYNILKEMGLSLKYLDSSTWSSREKPRFDSTVESFVKNLEDNTLRYLNECTETLKLAIKSYESVDKDLTNSIEKSE